jgi:hypothetical protein
LENGGGGAAHRALGGEVELTDYGQAGVVIGDLR